MREMRGKLSPRSVSGKGRIWAQFHWLQGQRAFPPVFFPLVPICLSIRARISIPMLHKFCSELTVMLHHEVILTSKICRGHASRAQTVESTPPPCWKGLVYLKLLLYSLFLSWWSVVYINDKITSNYPSFDFHPKTLCHVLWSPICCVSV